MLIIRLLSYLPFGILYLLSDFLFFVSYYIVRYRRRLVKKNLRNSFPGKTKNELSVIEKEFYRNLCDYAVEMLKLLTISKEELTRRMKFNEPEFVHQFSSKNQSILFLASHQFNWEWLLVSASISFPMAIDFVYQPIHNKLFERFSVLSRTRFGAHAIQRDEVARELVKRRNILRGVAIVADQYPGYKKDKKYPVKFLNQDTVFFLGLNNMAVLSQYPAVYYTIRKVKRGYYEADPNIVALPPYEKTETVVIDNYIKLVEQVINQYPSGWLWSHNRWKKRHLK
ncbi:lysophospholipid acyltransferase family protein [Chryseosolibacter indicus]|uniref:Lysophospholipid acyltransferase family protein n=1 Tax=Chryseosolibacter indicus TaxID=2782351 RepID=A0ABS5VZK9_9BACT|nr:lysophospholipid acyltransferase family protein [Chryseosolibacter indicus]MBT1705466.1 lysophospholipid acyltransferase family protein [Chryseosolibacter indicus]